jgi:hypothetical protein
MCHPPSAPSVADVTDDQPGDHSGQTAAKAAGKLLAAVLVITALFLLPLPRHLPQLVARWSPLPDLPGWLHFLLGPGKMLIIAALLVLGGISESQRRRRADRPDEPDDA